MGAKEWVWCISLPNSTTPCAPAAVLNISTASAGDYQPYTVAPGVDTVAVPDFDLDLLGHSYFSPAEALLYHIRDLMLNGEATVTRNRLAPAVEGSAVFSRLKR